jgi:glycosyltransferase involved in cell wall biosynthesis
MFNVLHINTRLSGGGAAVASTRLHEGLKQAGCDSKFMVASSSVDSQESERVPHDWKTRWLHRLVPLTGLNYLEYAGTSKIPQSAFYQQADVLNFHNLHRDFFSYLSLPRLTSNKPAVWTLHDMWSFTGHCAYSFDCNRWEIGCGNCPYLDIYPSVRRDATRWEWKLKRRAYSRSNITVIVTSKWLEAKVRKSILAEYFSIVKIPHGIDTDTFFPMDKKLCRTVLNIPVDKIVLMFSAMSVSDHRKGGDLLIEIMNRMPKSLKSNIVLLIMGEGGKAYSKMFDMEVLPIGYVSGEQLKVICYCAADLFLFPTRADIWSLVVQESMTCGTPCISFDIGGVPDLIRSGITGLLAPRENINIFRDSIVELVEDHKKRNAMGLKCREIVLKEYDIGIQVQKYLSIYEKLVGQNNQQTHKQNNLQQFQQ